MPPTRSWEEVRQLLYLEGAPIVRTRLHAIYLVMQGKSQRVTAHILSPSLRWVASLVDRCKVGVEAQVPQRPKLTAKEHQQVPKALQGPLLMGACGRASELDKAELERKHSPSSAS